MALTILADVLKILQVRDEAACIVKGDTNIMAKARRDLPSEWIIFYDEWSDWEDPITMFKNTIRPGKTRRVTGSIVFGCNWDPHELIRKCELSIFEQGGHGGLVDQFADKRKSGIAHQPQLYFIWGAKQYRPHCLCQSSEEAHGFRPAGSNCQ